MKMKKTVQIPEELFGRLCMYFLLDRTEPEYADGQYWQYKMTEHGLEWW